MRCSAAACLSPNDSVRSLKQRRGNRHASRAGCLEVDDELVMRQTLHGECARLSAFEDLVNVRGQSPPGLGPARAVRDQAHGVPVVPHEECGQPIPDRRFGDTPSMLDGRGHLQDQHGLGLLAARDRKSTRLNSSHGYISYAVFCLKKKTTNKCATVVSRL